MILPKTIKLGVHQVSVLRKQAEDPNAGWWQTSKNTMFVNDEFPHTQQVTTFLHEVMHALNFELPHDTIEWVAQGLAQVILDNKIDFKEKK